MAHICADPQKFAGKVRRFPIGTGSSGVTITITYNTETGLFRLSRSDSRPLRSLRSLAVGDRYFIRLLPRLCLVERMKGMFLIRGLCIHTSTLRSELLYQ